MLSLHRSRLFIAKEIGRFIVRQRRRPWRADSLLIFISINSRLLRSGEVVCQIPGMLLRILQSLRISSTPVSIGILLTPRYAPKSESPRNESYGELSIGTEIEGRFHNGAQHALRFRCPRGYSLLLQRVIFPGKSLLLDICLQ
jgi:hypothetical protein